MKFKEFLNYFDVSDIEYTQLGKKFFILSDKQKELDKLTDKDLYYGGLLLGEERRGRFTPSFMLLDLVMKKTDKKIVVKDDAEFLFICGRDLLGTSLADFYTFEVDTIVLVVNSKNECLGLGKVVLPLRLKDRIVISNIFDLGDFIRREKK